MWLPVTYQLHHLQLSCCDRHCRIHICNPFSSTPATHHTGRSTSSECLPLRCPDHGFVDIVNNSPSVTEAVYSCEEGFVLRGDHKRYCQRNGQWTGRDPHCSVAIGKGLKGWSGVMWWEGHGVE